MRRRLIRNIIFITSLFLVFYGFYREEYKTVFEKAINICLECIGIG